jgi:hypothetical protein
MLLFDSLRVVFEKHNPDKPEKFFITKAQKYENTKKIIIKFRAFPIACFRDCFYFFATKSTNLLLRNLKPKRKF